MSTALRRPRRFLRVLFKGSCVLGLMLGGCSMSEPGMTESSVPEVAPDGQADSERPVRLPAIRLSGRQAISIDSLVDKADETVTIAGTVAARAAVLEGWLYQIEDETGDVWVLSNSTEPEVGQPATVEGIVRYESIVVGEIDAGDVYLEEKAYRQGEG